MNEHPETPAALIHYTRTPEEDVSPFDVFSHQWRLFARVIMVYGCLAVAVGMVLLLFSSSYITYRLPFRFDFKGVEKNAYPNGQVFDATDVLDTQILTKVYEASRLKEQMNLDEFRNSFTVAQSGDEMDKLRRDYQTKIANPKLTVVERDKVEQEYTDKLKSMPRDNYGITFSPPNKTELKISPREVDNVIEKVLTTWSDVAVAQGRFAYQVSLFTRNIIDATMCGNGDDYVVTNDMLRVAAERVQKSVKELGELPGAMSHRSTTTAPSLGELSVRIEDLLRYRITPLLSFVRNRGTTTNLTATIEYLRGQVYQLNQNSKILEDRAKNLRDVLDQYVRQGERRDTTTGTTPSLSTPGSANGGVIAQLGDSFLDRMIEISKRSGEQEFRKEMAERLAKLGDERALIDKDMRYYTDFLKALEEAPIKPQDEIAKDTQYASVQSKQIMEILGKSMDDINAFYASLSQANLRGRSSTFVIIGPVEKTIEAGLSWKMIVAGLAAAGALVLGITYLLAMYRMRRMTAVVART